VEPRHAGLRADVYVAMRFPALSRTRVKQKIMQGESLLNGRRYASSARLRPGDRLELFWRAGAPPDPCLAGPAPRLEILYEDAQLIAVNKPAGVPVHPTGRKQSLTLIQLLRSRDQERISASLAGGDTSYYPSLVNRLDLFTSGAVLVAKDRVTLVAMHRLIAAGEVHKRYLALAAGSFAHRQGRIELPLGPDPESAIGIKQAAREDGLPALTEYRVIDRVGGHTLLEARPRTGRQHQVRVHLAALGHPIWGDLIYADETLFLRYYANGCRLDEGMPPRQALHAQQLRFRHPVESRDVEILAPPPPDFLAILEQLRGT
jgi:23S rRNA pseudouridine1911/1915/1917 synthase